MTLYKFTITRIIGGGVGDEVYEKVVDYGMVGEAFFYLKFLGKFVDVVGSMNPKLKANAKWIPLSQIKEVNAEIQIEFLTGEEFEDFKRGNKGVYEN